LHPAIDGISEDLRKAAAVGGEETARVAELIVSGIQPTLRLHLIEVLHLAAQELEDSAPGVSVEVRLVGRDPVLSLGAPAPTPTADVVDRDQTSGFAAFADGELLRLTIRLPEGVKAAVERAAAAAGASINSWIVAALARSLDGPAPSSLQLGRRMPRRITGFVQG
jgi:Arc-like DNA binding domain